MINILLKDALFEACAAVGVEPAQVRRWKKQKQEIRAQILMIHRCTRVSFLTDVEDEILFWFFELLERGMKISVRRMVMLKASCELVPELRLKTDQLLFADF